MSDGIVPFNRPRLSGGEQENIAEAGKNLYLSGNGPFTRRCAAMLERELGVERVLLTPSGTAALELGVLLLDLKPGDEVIMPSFTFPTTASAVALHGGIPVFVDVRPDTLNIDPACVGAAVTQRTRAVLPVHYAGVACNMAALREVAPPGASILEDAAHAIDATQDGRALGSFGELAAFSFHETKNVTCGEGGALAINDARLVKRAEILQEKGTNRAAFFRGEVDKYTWVDVGSSFVLSDLNAAFLLAQLEHVKAITDDRRRTWARYYAAFEELELAGLVTRPVIPAGAHHNGHLFYLLVQPPAARETVLETLRAAGVNAVFHYVPLHTSPAGRRVGRSSGSLSTTDRVSEQLIRLPLWAGMSDEIVSRVVETVAEAIQNAAETSGSPINRPA